MEWRGLGIIAVMVAAPALLAGCTEASTDTGPVVITDPDDFSYLNETGMTDRPHIHDYWDGTDNLTVIDQDRHHVGLASGSGTGYNDIRFYPPDGSIIPLGTSAVKITTHIEETYRDGDDPYRLAVKTAADDEAQPFTEFASGDTVTFPTENSQNDIPHQRISAWRFDVQVPRPYDSPVTGDSYGSHEIDLQITVEAIRGLEIPPYPPHPDLWGNQTELPLADGGSIYTHNRQDGGNCYGCTNHDQVFPHDGEVVPHDADHVRINISYDWAEPFGLDLYYHGADTREMSVVEPESESGGAQGLGGQRTYIIPVDENADSPYALQSMWRFHMRPAMDTPISSSAGTYELIATVQKEAP